MNSTRTGFKTEERRRHESIFKDKSPFRMRNKQTRFALL